MSRPQWGPLRRPSLLMRVAIMDAAIEAGTTPTVAASAMREVAEPGKGGDVPGIVRGHGRSGDRTRPRMDVRKADRSVSRVA